MTLRLKGKYTDEEIVCSALLEKIWEAERQMEEMIRQAASILRPLGVTDSDVRTLVVASVHRDEGE